MLFRFNENNYNNKKSLKYKIEKSIAARLKNLVEEKSINYQGITCPSCENPMNSYYESRIEVNSRWSGNKLIAKGKVEYTIYNICNNCGYTEERESNKIEYSIVKNTNNKTLYEKFF